MKNKLYIIIAFPILLGTLNSCEDFLALAPISQANVVDFYQTPADLNIAVIAAYQAQKQTWNTMLAVRDDNAGFKSLTDHVDNFTKDIGYGVYETLWNTSYSAIYRCNIAIEKAPGITMAETLRNQYLGELRFLRAITYFDLVRYFGGVPLVIETAKSLEQDVVNVFRNTAAEVYDQIVADLVFAEANLPVSYTQDEYVGRATKGAANAFLGKVYLTIGKKTEAQTALRKVLTYGYELLPNFEDVFGATNGNNKEIVFELQYKSTTDPNSIIWAFRSINLDLNPGVGFAPATQDLYDAFEPGDPRRDITLALDDIDIYYCVKYKDPGANPISDANNNIPLMRYSDVLLLLAESLGETSESYSLINQVRNRVGLGNIDGSTPGTFTEKLLHERRVELAYENHRWHDLLRFGVALQVMNAHFQKEKNGQITIVGDNLLFPIPNGALINNINLEQNPGYPGR